MGISPMMQHYLQTKEKYKDCILFYRLGDFYEMFFEDANICSRILELTLTGKDCGLTQRAPMCGIPYHASETYISKLIQNGYKVAICEQLTEPQKGVKIVERDVVRVVTPGTVIDTSMLDEKSNNYILSLYKEKNNIGASVIDISTGEYVITQFEDNSIDKINEFIVMFKPSEVVCNIEMSQIYEDLPCYKMNYIPKFSLINEEYFEYKNSLKLMLEFLKTNTLKEFNCANKTFAICSSGGLLNYLKETQKRNLQNITIVKYFNAEKFMQIDINTRRNLELIETNKDRKKTGSLFWLLDKTKTNMGARRLKSYIEQPLYDENEINLRLNAVEQLIKNILQRDNLKQLLYNIFDIERLCGKLSYGNITPKDCIALSKSLSLIPDIKSSLSNFDAKLLIQLNENIDNYTDIVTLINNSIVDNPPLIIKDGGYIKKGFNKELDELIDISKQGKSWIANLENQEKEKTGIKNLKIGYNKVFGYYIEVLNSQKSLVPFNYQRKQTIINAERYITTELKEMEDKILNAEDKKIFLENKIYDEIKSYLLKYIISLQKTSKSLSILDVLLSFATVSIENNYCKPVVSSKLNFIEITDGRHPVVEKVLKDEQFIANDTFIDDNDSKIMIITGPNMAGKSTYMRQVALITLLSHIGCFVPAKSAKISLTDKIFTRVGASDDLSFGQSTFMVEMVEVSNIIKNATNNSLIILDEVGRGTSTFDGLSIAWSVMNYLSENINAKTLFSTHYHELTQLEGVLKGVKNYRVNVKEFNDSIIFLRKIVRGSTNKSFGIEVASLAGLPCEIIDKAKAILHALESNSINNDLENIVKLDDKLATQNNKIKQNTNKILQILNDIDENNLTPLNAFDILIQLKNYLK